MKKVIATLYISLDGVVQDPSWTMKYWNDEIAKFKYAELFSSDSLLLGRITYQGFAAAWPTQKDEQGFADRMNNLPKIVVSTTLDKAEWNNSIIIHENIPAEIAALKQQPGQDILIYGSATLIRSLLQAGLVDELVLLVYPVVLGAGDRLFTDGMQVSLELLNTQPFSSGAVALTYRTVS
jgi:dihydrofolate reductase